MRIGGIRELDRACGDDDDNSLDERLQLDASAEENLSFRPGTAECY